MIIRYLMLAELSFFCNLQSYNSKFTENYIRLTFVVVSYKMFC